MNSACLIQNTKSIRSGRVSQLDMYGQDYVGSGRHNASGSWWVRDLFLFFFFQAEDGIRDYKVTGVQTCALPICMIKFVCVDSPSALRSGNTRPLVGSVSGGALPALSCQVWKCIASVGPMLSRMRDRKSGV